jgi:hypothetical protein
MRSAHALTLMRKKEPFVQLESVDSRTGISIDRHFDYTNKILVAVEFADAPRKLDNMPPSYSVFQRLAIPEVMKAFDATQSWFVQLLAGRHFHEVLDERMGYWEKLIPAGKQCFVHYAIGAEDVVARAMERLKSRGGFVQLGVYHVEPQSSAYPFGFPRGTTPNHWDLGKTYPATADSIFWFNFFPAQPFLFEQTFAIWAVFQVSQLKERGECNQLVTSDGKERLFSEGILPFVQINLNRFTNLSGYFQSAHEAGRHTFTVNSDYTWYGMLLRQV